MRRLFCLQIVSFVLLVHLTPGAAVRAQDLILTDDIPTAEMKAEIDGLIEQLGAEKYRDRKRAETELKKIGLVAIEPLQAVSPYADTEIRLRARRLIQILRKQFVSEGVPPSLKHFFNGYDEMSVNERRLQLTKIIALPIALESGLLSRLARFEEDDELSKFAALAVLRSNLEDPEVRDRLLIGIGYSERSACQWIRSYVESHTKPDQSLLQLRDLLSEEQRLMAAGSASTSRDIVDGLAQRIVDLLFKAGREQEAFDEVRQVAVNGQTALQRLWAVDWLIKHSAWEVIVDLAEVEKFKENSLLLYRLAEAASKAGNDEQAEQLANQAFQLAGRGIEDYPVVFNSFLMTLAKQDPTNTNRLAMAVSLAETRGMSDWAEREYRQAISTEDVSVLNYASSKLSELLHDQQRDEEAANVRAEILERVDNNKALKELFQAYRMEYESRMHYYRACDARLKGRFDEEVVHLKKAVEVDPQDIEALIAIFRAKGADEELQTSNRKRIKLVAATYLNRITKYESRLKLRNPNTPFISKDLITDENQFAWLVGNTEGDIDEAIRRSEHTVRERPADGGYIDTLARCYYRKGNFEKAVKLQKMAVELLPFNQQIRRQLNTFEEALAAANDPQDAPSESQSPEPSDQP